MNPFVRWFCDLKKLWFISFSTLHRIFLQWMTPILRSPCYSLLWITAEKFKVKTLRLPCKTWHSLVQLSWLSCTLAYASKHWISYLQVQSKLTFEKVHNPFWLEAVKSEMSGFFVYLLFYQSKDFWNLIFLSKR